MRLQLRMVRSILEHAVQLLSVDTSLFPRPASFQTYPSFRGQIKPLSRADWLTEILIPAALTLHNLVFQARLMGQARTAILEDRFPAYLKTFFSGYYKNGQYPEWCVNALGSVGVDLLEGLSGEERNGRIQGGRGAGWEYASDSAADA